MFARMRMCARGPASPVAKLDCFLLPTSYFLLPTDSFLLTTDLCARGPASPVAKLDDGAWYPLTSHIALDPIMQTEAQVVQPWQAKTTWGPGLVSMGVTWGPGLVSMGVTWGPGLVSMRATWGPGLVGLIQVWDLILRGEWSDFRVWRYTPGLG